jgi:hypothetical protein
MFQSQRFRFRTFRKTLPEASEQEVDEAVEAVAVVFVHAEAGDAERRDSLMGKARKNVKWIANKRGLRNIVLHSFTHLAESKAEPAFAEGFLEDLAAILRSGGYGVWVTPFGYTCEWKLEVFGESLAKVFKSL